MVASNIPLLKHWEYTGQAKIALQISSEEDLLLLEATAQSLNLCARSIQDAGRTQIAAGSRTVLGIGPGEWAVSCAVRPDLKLIDLPPLRPPPPPSHPFFQLLFDSSTRCVLRIVSLLQRNSTD